MYMVIGLMLDTRTERQEEILFDQIYVSQWQLLSSNLFIIFLSLFVISKYVYFNEI